MVDPDVRTAVDRNGIPTPHKLAEGGLGLQRQDIIMIHACKLTHALMSTKTECQRLHMQLQSHRRTDLNVLDNDVVAAAEVQTLASDTRTTTLAKECLVASDFERVEAGVVVRDSCLCRARLVVLAP